MADYIFISITFLIIITVAILAVKFILIPLFFPNYFPKHEVLNFLASKNLHFLSSKKVKQNSFKEDLEEDIFLSYRTSFFEVETEDKERNTINLKVKQSKSNSLFHKNKIEFFFKK